MNGSSKSYHQGLMDRRYSLDCHSALINVAAVQCVTTFL